MRSGQCCNHGIRPVCVGDPREYLSCAQSAAPKISNVDKHTGSFARSPCQKALVNYDQPGNVSTASGLVLDAVDTSCTNGDTTKMAIPNVTVERPEPVFCSGRDKVKVCSYIALYPVLGTLHPLADLFIPTPSQLLWEASSHAVITARRLFVQISTPVCSQVLVYTDV